MKLEYLTLLGIGYCLVDKYGALIEKNTLFKRSIPTKAVQKVLKKKTPIMIDDLLVLKDGKGVLIFDKLLDHTRHELKNNLNTIHGILALIKDNTDGETEEYATMAYNESIALNEKIDGLR